MAFVDISGDQDDGIKGVMYPISLGQSVFDERRQVLPISDELVIITQFRTARMLLKEHYVVLDCLSSLPQLFKRRELVSGLVHRFKPRSEGSDKCWVIGKWRCEGLHSLEDASGPVGSISFQE